MAKMYMPSWPDNIPDYPLDIIVDVETTGLKNKSQKGGRDEIVSLAAIALDPRRNYRLCGTFFRNCNPGREIPKQASEIHGIYDHHVAACWPAQEVVRLFFHDFLRDWHAGGYRFIGHNLKFDLGFLDFHRQNLAEYRELGDDCLQALNGAWANSVDTMQFFCDVHAGNQQIEGMKTSRYGKGYIKLDACCRNYKIPHDVAHNALGDCLVTAELYRRLVEDHNREKVDFSENEAWVPGSDSD